MSRTAIATTKSVKAVVQNQGLGVKGLKTSTIGAGSRQMTSVYLLPSADVEAVTAYLSGAFPEASVQARTAEFITMTWPAVAK